MSAHFGSISSGTMLSRDLISAFACVLRELASKTALPPYDGSRDHIELCDECDLWIDIEDDQAWVDYEKHEELGGQLLEELFDALDSYAPDYGYFGAHPDDGADYGFWLHDDWQQMAEDSDALFVEDTSEVPDDYTGEVVHINDHGNCTLYAADNGVLTEVWSMV